MWFRNKNTMGMHNQTMLIIVTVVAVLVAACYALTPVAADGKRFFGVFTLIPVLSVLVLALLSKRTLEPLCAGAIIGLLMALLLPLPPLWLQSLVAPCLVKFQLWA